MSADEKVVPYKTIAFGEGEQASWYMLPFDREGNCTGPLHRAAALEEAASQAVTDVFVFAHGWKNHWRAATERYESFIEGFRQTHAQGHGLTFDAAYKPLLIGIFWPSVVLLTPDERAPMIAAGVPDTDIAEIAAALPAEQGERLTALLSGGPLDLADARALAELAAPLYAVEDDAAEASAPPTPEDLLAVWQPQAAAEPDSQLDPSTFGTVSEQWAGAAQAAAFSLDPRKLANMLMVRTMKDRAGVVGARGVGPLLRELLQVSDARVHMIGHSYGCKVCMSAICAQPLPVGTAVDSLLLLQPAVNHRCFAADAGNGRPGGYRAVLDRVTKPVLSTYSAHDDALRNWFHHALTRGSDMGEAAIAALPGLPSPYAALGGYGPRGAELQTKQVDLRDPGRRYPPQANGTRLLAIDATRGIPGHGAISNAYTWWALYDQVAQP